MTIKYKKIHPDTKILFIGSIAFCIFSIFSNLEPLLFGAIPLLILSLIHIHDDITAAVPESSVHRMLKNIKVNDEKPKTRTAKSTRRKKSKAVKK